MISKKFLIIVSLFFLAGNVLVAQTNIGAAKCKMCHNKTSTGQQFKKWSEGPHAKAMSRLDATQAKDPKCLKCHQTNSAFPNEGVSCESCHGPGSKYKSMTIMKDHAKSVANGLIEPNEALCKTCHNSESPDFKGFDYAKYSAQIAHPNPANE